nr:hypothetical protein [uncultured Undibacterium sp.]
MKNVNFQRLFLRFHIKTSIHRYFSYVLVILMMLTAYLYFQFIPKQQAQLIKQKSTLTHFQSDSVNASDAKSSPKITEDEQRIASFYDSLGERQFSEQYIKVFFDVASKAGIVLNSAEYRSAEETNGAFRRYQVTLPLKGSYLQIRQFCRDTLIALPFVSLDEINFKREEISNSLIEANLQFTLYLMPESKNKVVSSPESAFE